MADITKTWSQVTQLLEDAADALPASEAEGGGSSEKLASGPLMGSLAEFEDFLSHNELELAWDALAAVATRQRAGPVVWLLLVQAAALMGLKARARKAAQMSVKAEPRKELGYRLVVQRQYRTRTGKIVWRRRTSAAKSKLEPV